MVEQTVTQDKAAEPSLSTSGHSDVRRFRTRDRILAVFLLVIVLAIVVWGFFFQPSRNNPFESIDRSIWLRGRELHRGYAEMPYVPAGTDWKFQPRALWTETRPCCGIGASEHIPTFLDGHGALHAVRRIYYTPSEHIFIISISGELYTLANDLESGVWQKVKLPALYSNDDKYVHDYSVVAPWKVPASVTAMTVAFTGGVVVTGGNDGVVRVWRYGSPKEEWSGSKHAQPITSVAFSPAGSIASASQDGTARIWDASPDRWTTAGVWDALASRDTIVLKGHTKSVNSVVFSNDGKQLLTASDDGSARLWDTHSGRFLRAFDENKNGLRLALFLPEQEWVATLSADGWIRLWDGLRSGQLRGQMKTDPIRAAVVSPDSSSLVVATASGIAAFSLKTPSNTPLWRVPGKDATTVAFSPDGQRIAWTSALGALSILSSDGRVLHEVRQSLPAGATSLSYWPDGRSILVNTPNGPISKIETEHGPLPHLDAISSPSNDDAPTAKADPLWVGGADGYIAYTRNGLPWTRLNYNRLLGSSSGAEYAYDRDILSLSANGPFTAIALGSGNLLLYMSSVYAYQDAESSTSKFSGVMLTRPIREATPHNLLGAYFSDTNSGWVVGDGGVILHTTDGGQSFIKQYENADLKLHDILVEPSRVGSSVGWAAGWSVRTPAPGPLRVVATNQAAGTTAVWVELPDYPGRWIFWLALPALVLAASLNVWVWQPNTPVPLKCIEEIGAKDTPLSWNDPQARSLKPLARSLSRFLRNVKTRPPLTLGITGRWGSGKSSLMQLLKTDLQFYGGKAVWFNAWHHRDEDDLLAALFAAIRRQATPGWWSLPGVTFRIRLFWSRSKADLTSVAYATLFLGIILLTVGYAAPLGGVVEWIESVTRMAGLSEKSIATLRQVLPTLVPLSAAGVGTLVALWTRGKLIALPANPAKLAAAVARRATLRDFSAKLAFRSEFGEQFGDVCEALLTDTSPGLVIFIDDLDRCPPDDVLKILEAVNYLASAGPCTIVLGMDRDRVEDCVSVGFKKLIDDIPKEDAATKRLDEDEKRQGQRTFAARYLEKLINIDVSIPALTDTQTETLLTGATASAQVDGAIPGPAPANSQDATNTRKSADEPDWLRPLKAGLRWLRQVTLTGVVPFLIGLLLVWQIDSDRVRGQINGPPEAVSTPDAPATSAPTPLSASSEPTSEAGITKAARIRISSWQPTTDALSSSHWVWSTFALVILGIGVGLAIRGISLYKRRALSDSPAFVEALRLVTPIFLEVSATPRMIKRYQNKMRYLAARLRPVTHEPDSIDILLHWLGNGWHRRGFLLAWPGIRWLQNQIPSDWFELQLTTSIREPSLILLGALESLHREAFHEAKLGGILRSGTDVPNMPKARQEALDKVRSTFNAIDMPTDAEIEHYKFLVGLRLPASTPEQPPDKKPGLREIQTFAA